MNKYKKNNTCIITGGARGIGQACAIALAKQNNNIVICSRTQSELDNTAHKIYNLNNNIKIITLCLDILCINSCAC